jgi:hypothetical protein
MFVAISLLAAESVVLLTRVLAPSTEGQPSVPGTPAAPPPQLAQARFLAALRSKIPIKPVAIK